MSDKAADQPPQAFIDCRHRTRVLLITLTMARLYSSVLVTGGTMETQAAEWDPASLSTVIVCLPSKYLLGLPEMFVCDM